MSAVTATSIAIVGVGKIARDQHVPAISGNDAFHLAATVSSQDGIDGVENFRTLDDLLARRPDVTALALCMPPQARYEAAARAIAAGRDVLLEKPPGATVAEVEALVAMARERKVALFATWHSRFAAAVEPARRWLADKAVRHMQVTWKEDVRRWHPGQAWIWEPGGLGIFDPGINALSIVTAILPEPVRLVSSTLEFPDGRDAPIAARLRFAGSDSLVVEADFDWRQTGPQTWDIEVETDAGLLSLAAGGAEMSIAGQRIHTAGDVEYRGIYRRFAELLTHRAIDADLSPLVHVADAFMLGRRLTVEPFED
jgi:D-galactose 1-dehydrogenase